MKVLLICANRETMNMPPLPLGLACVAEATRRAGHDAELIDLMYEEDAVRAIRRSLEDVRPDVIGISVRNIDDQNMERPGFFLDSIREVVSSCRSMCRAPIVLGGAGYSMFPESALRYLGADMGIQGEGEAAFPSLLERLARAGPVSDIPGVFLPGMRPVRRSFEKNLDDLPLPDPGLLAPPGADLRNLWVPVQTRRGCPMDCIYCSTSAIEGRPVRRRSPDRIVRWLTDLREAGFRNINFVDNTFNLPPPYAKALCRAILRAGLDLRLWCIVYPKWVDAELVDLMRRAGCRQVSLGFESGSDRMLRTLNKHFRRDEVRTVSKRFGEAGIERMGFLLLGGPGETKDTVEESLSFADSLNLDSLKVTAGIRIYPHTPLAGTAIEEGVIRPDDDLLLPCFYLAAGLRDWLPGRIAAYGASRPWVNFR
ncbi:MAG: radical domain iron-sulfur cluster-binding oxidoreductase with cobalamin-binding-like domain [Deltaproteobacteria bacterium]|nr:radical domain iron-sulfur cluster-binding oxidoreductase with cobalamin-binding-like domain [Deltaproteobacteria bacterium]